MVIRRRFLAGLSAFSVGSLSGCSALTFDSPPQRWRLSLGSDGQYAALALGNDTLYGLVRDGGTSDLHAVSRTGEQQWQAGFGFLYGLTADGKGVYVAAEPRSFESRVRVYAYHGGPKPEWKGDVDHGSTLAVDDERLYVGGDGNLGAFDRTGGTREWSLDSIEVRSLAVGESLFAGGYRTLFAYDPSDGTQRWHANGGGGVTAAPARIGSIVAVPTSDGLAAFDAADGTPRWQTGKHTNVVTTGGGTVYAGTGGSRREPGSIVAVDSEDGTEKGQLRTDAPVHSLSVAGDVLSAGVETGELIVLDRDTLTERWRISVSERFFGLVSDETGVFVLADTGTLRAFDF